MLLPAERLEAEAEAAPAEADAPKRGGLPKGGFVVPETLVIGAPRNTQGDLSSAAQGFTWSLSSYRQCLSSYSTDCTASVSTEQPSCLLIET